MRIKTLSLLAIMTLVMSSCCSSSKEKENNIFPKGDIIDNEYFNGKAWWLKQVTDTENFDTTVGTVLFEAGVRNNWHSHAGGQILIATEGEGYYQEKGKPIQLLNAGDVVEILPNVIHWHGATPNTDFEHIAIGTQVNKGGVEWLGAVSGEEYGSYVVK